MPELTPNTCEDSALGSPGLESYQKIEMFIVNSTKEMRLSKG